jgi:pyrroloquinoline quinone biosynthesis protein E
MPRAEWTDVIDQVKGLGTLEVIFTGGEPLLRDDIADLVAHAHQRGLLTRLSTNAYLLDRERVVELKRAGLDQCGISMDDADPAVHDSLRRLPGLHDRATRALRLLREQGIRTRVLAYASHRTVPEGLKRIIRLGRGLGVDSVYINIPFAAGRWTGSFDEVLSEDEMAEVRAVLEPGFVYTEFPTPETRCCAFQKRMLLITATGEVTPCPVIPYPVGRLREASLGEIYRRHVQAMRLTFRGTCPMNDERGREALRAHAKAATAGTSGTQSQPL